MPFWAPTMYYVVDPDLDPGVETVRSVRSHNLNKERD